MNFIQRILQMNDHRPYPMPRRPWKYYQEWHDVLFAHWKVPLKPLRELVPQGLDIDLFEGQAWVSLVAFKVKKLRPHFIPPFPPVSDFLEINMRTYVTRHGKSGIYFFSLEAEKTVSALLGKYGIGLPYMKSIISHPEGIYDSFNPGHDFYLKVKYIPRVDVHHKSPLDKWLTERYCLFLERAGKIVGNDIHHFEWPLQMVDIEKLMILYRFNNLLIDHPASLYHYSPGVYAPTWELNGLCHNQCSLTHQLSRLRFHQRIHPVRHRRPRFHPNHDRHQFRSLSIDWPILYLTLLSQ
jgi:uncharacterized protein YqjF (DUF2071 family)